MSEFGVMLAAHGAGDGSPANRRVSELATELCRVLGGMEVVVGLRLGSPSFADALAGLACRDVIVVPAMTSDGYFRRAVLPEALEPIARRKQMRLRVTPPLGTHPEIPAIAAEGIRDACDRCDHPIEGATLIVVGHGTRRSARSHEATYGLVEALRQRLRFESVEPAFLDEPPLLENVAQEHLDRPLVVLPFLLGGGGHARVDIPQRVGLDPAECVDTPVRVRDVLLVGPLGDSPRLVALLADLVHKATAESQPCGSL